MEGREGAQPSPPPSPRSLNETFYLPRSANPSCFQLSKLGDDVKFEFRRRCITMLPKFFGHGDACS